MNNLVDLTGMVFQTYERVTDERAILFFVLNVQEKYPDSNGEWVTRYQKIPCSISKRLDSDRTAQYDYLKKYLVKGSLIRVRGKLSGYYEEFDFADEENKTLLLNRVWIQDFEFLNTFKTNEAENERTGMNETQTKVTDEENVENLYNFKRPIKFGEE